MADALAIASLFILDGSKTARCVTGNGSRPEAGANEARTRLGEQMGKQSAEVKPKEKSAGLRKRENTPRLHRARWPVNL
jgi:hypothetical protein